MAALNLPGPILVTGAGGFVARAVSERLGLAAVTLTRAELDICDAGAVERVLGSCRPWALVNGAAWADVDRCELDPEGAWHANAEGPALLARACARRGVRLLHISTDYVFGGRAQERYGPRDLPCPVNVYGRTKAEGERRVLEAWPRAIIARTAWAYGPGGRGFGSVLPSRLLAGTPVRAIADRFGHPTYVRDLAVRVLDLLRAERSGIYHAVNQGPTSWYLFATRMAGKLGVPADLVQGVRGAELSLPAPRPVRLELETEHSGADGMPALRSWQEAQDAYLHEIAAAAGD